METTTVLFRLRFTIKFSDEMLAWLNNFSDAWFSQDGGNSFLREYGGTWTNTFDRIVNQEIHDYFSQLGLPDAYMPFIQHGETFSGSWVMEAAIVMRGTMGSAYNALRGLSDLSNIAEGFTRLKSQMLQKLDMGINQEVKSTIYQAAQSLNTISLTDAPQQLPPLPPKPVVTDLIIDARPLRSLTPAAMKSHKIHLSVAISRDVFTLENLGDEPLRDVQIGLFKTTTERSQWNYADSYMGNFPLVSSRQTIAKNLGEFRDQVRNIFDLSDGQAVYVDCWISDSLGIYIFRFFLEHE
jgi:hypothetical protein